MRHYVGLDVGLESTSICVIDRHGEIVREGKAETSSKAIREFLKRLSLSGGLVGLEACSVSDWLAPALIARSLPVVCIEARHARGILKANINKTDANDARGIAVMLRMGVYRRVHLKTPDSRLLRALLTARRVLLIKAVALESAIMGLVRTFGLKMPKVRSDRFEAHVRKLLQVEPALSSVIEPLLTARACLRREFERLDEQVAAAVKADPVCRRLMTAPGVGPIAAAAFRSAVDDPSRFKRSRSVGPYLGLTPRTSQSGVKDVRGRISHMGDATARTALFAAARAIMHPRTRTTPLQDWARQVAERRGGMRALVALARKLAVILHRMWIDGRDYETGVADA
jgi:transposase